MLASEKKGYTCFVKLNMIFKKKESFFYMCLQFVTTNFVWIKCCKWKNNVLDQNLGHILAKT